MARLIRYQPSFRGMKALRCSRGIDEMLERRAHNVAVMAQAAYDADLPNTGRVEVEVLNDSASDTSEPRSRVAVIARHPAALRIEAERRPLGGAISAART